MNQLSFFKLIKEIIKKSFTLSGRDPKESILAYLFFLVLLEASLSFIYHFTTIKIGYQFIFSFLPLIPLPSLFIRRLHDHNKNLGFTLLPFFLFVILLPFLNFKVFDQNIQNEKLISGGIIIEIIAVLFLIQFFLFFIFLFSKGNKNENLYGVPYNYILTLPKKRNIIISFSLLFSFIFLIFLLNKENSIQKQPLNIPSSNHIQKQEKTASSKSFHQKKQAVFHKFAQIETQKRKKISLAQKDKTIQFDSIKNEIKVNELLHFLFSLSIQSIKKEQEISYSENTPNEIILIKAKNGDIVFILKDFELLPLIKKQSIDCKKEVCYFKSNKYLKTMDERY